MNSKSGRSIESNATASNATASNVAYAKPFQPTSIETYNAPPLEGDEAIAACRDLFVPPRDYRRINRRWCDPIHPSEPQFALISIIKCDQGDGVIGVAKIRGISYTQEEGKIKSEHIIRNVDSEHSVFLCRIGVPFPLTDSKFAEEVNEIDMDDKINGIMERGDMEQRKRERAEMQDIKRREELLLKDGSSITVDPFDVYLENRVKLAHLSYTIADMDNKKKECMQARIKCKKYLRVARQANPEFDEQYMEKYLAARRAAHIPEDTDDTGIMKYIREPLEDCAEDHEPIAPGSKRHAADEDDASEKRKFCAAADENGSVSYCANNEMQYDVSSMME